MSERIISESWAILKSGTIKRDGFGTREEAEQLLEAWREHDRGFSVQLSRGCRVARVRVVEVSETEAQRRKEEA